MVGPPGVSVVAGFLGSGKTTFLNRVLRADVGVRMAVLVNDFGELNIDAEFIESHDGDTIALTNGCICCTIRDDLLSALRRVFSFEPKVEHVLIEASGVADPRAMSQTFFHLEQQKRIRLDARIAVVDAEQLPALGPRDLSLAHDQMSESDVVLINKCDAAERTALDWTRKEVAKFAPRAAVAECEYAGVPLELVLGVGASTPQSEQPDPVDHADEFTTFAFESAEPLYLAQLRQAAVELPAGIYRAKGVVALHELPEHAVHLNVVGRRARVDRGSAWGDRPRTTRIVCIGRSGGVDLEQLQRHFYGCAQAPARPSVLSRAIDWVRRRT